MTSIEESHRIATEKERMAVRNQLLIQKEKESKWIDQNISNIPGVGFDDIKIENYLSIS